MAINNLNPRRTVWFSPNEPSNKYDIWLSRNAHYDENGEPTTDSNAQRDCDYIFKIYDCGKWNPIVGFNSTAANKINTVTGTSYQYTFDGDSYTSSDKLEFDLPLFTKESPLELFSAGPLGVAVNKFITDAQWNTIYTTHIKNIIEYNKFNLWPAEANKLGGIWADTFTINDIVYSTQSNNSASTYSNWLAQVKYKPNHGSSDYNLYVSAKDIITIVNKYEEDNPDAPGILPGSDFELWLATTTKTGGIRADTHIMGINGFKPIECKYYPNQTLQSLYYGRLSVSVKDIIDGIDDYFNLDPEGGNDFAYSLFVDTRSISRRRYAEEYEGQNQNVGFEIWGAGNENNAGKILRLKEAEYWPITPDPESLSYTNSCNSISWVECEDIVKDGTNYSDNLQPLVLLCTNGAFDWVPMQSSSQYNVLSLSDHDLETPYVINGVGNIIPLPENCILNGVGGWSRVSHGNGIINNITSSEIEISANILQKTNSTSWGSSSVVTVSKAQNTDYIHILDNSDSSVSVNVLEFLWLQITALSTILFDSTLSLYKSGNPVYIYIGNVPSKILFSPTVIYRIDEDVLTNSSNYDAVLITIQFGIVKVEGCNILSSTPQ